MASGPKRRATFTGVAEVHREPESLDPTNGRFIVLAVWTILLDLSRRQNKLVVVSI